MKYIFFESRLFTRRIAELASAELYRRLQNDLQADPLKGEVIQGCGGIRKIRLESPGRGKGKRGGLRVIYLHIPEARRIYFVAVYGKDEQDDLDAGQREQLKALAEETRKALRDKLRRT